MQLLRPDIGFSGQRELHALVHMSTYLAEYLKCMLHNGRPMSWLFHAINFKLIQFHESSQRVIHMPQIVANWGEVCTVAGDVLQGHLFSV